MANITLREVILASDTLDEDLVVYAKKIGDRFLDSSDAVLLSLTEDEQAIKTDELARLKCSGFSYFLEMFLIQEMIEDLDPLNESERNARVARVICYAEYDA